MRFNPSVLAIGITQLFIATAMMSAADGDDWPQWRGPKRDGILRETGLVDSIPESGLPVRWRARILNGWSGPAVATGRVFVTDHNLLPSGDGAWYFRPTNRLLVDDLPIDRMIGG